MKEKLRVLKRIFSEINYIIESKHRKKYRRLFLMIFVGSWFELLGVTAVLPFVYALMDTEKVMENKYAKPVLDFFGINESMKVLVFLGVGIIILYVAKNAFLLFSSYYQMKYNSRIQKELNIKMLHSFLSRPYQYFLDTTIGEITRACSQDISSVYGSIQILFGLAMSLFTTLLIGIYMIISDPVIAMGTLSVAIIAVLILTKVLKPIMKRLANQVMQASVKKNNSFNQTLFGIKELYVMGRQDLFIETYDSASEELRKISIRQGVLDCIPNRLIESLFIAGFIGVVLLRLSMGGDPATFVPKLASFALGAFKVLPYISGITNKINGLVYNHSFIDDAYKNMLEVEAYQKEMEEYAKNHSSLEGYYYDDESIHFENEIYTKNVLWKYSKGKTPVLTDANIMIKKGESIGLVGVSGAGKTTLADIVLGLLKPQEGSVYMDGRDIFAMPKTWARIVGYVPQNVFLLAGSVKENVAFGMREYTEEQIWEALDKAQMGEFVRKLPEGLDTYVGERGVKLSGGQRQRIAIARALANQPEILVLDEATSALDNETENAIMESINSLQGQITMVIVAHRLTTIEKCNRIYRIGDGVATEVDKEEVLGR